MRPSTWLTTTILAIVIATSSAVGLNVLVDVYGLYRPVHGRKLVVLGDERVAKYLFSMRYVPENFNALIDGASITANWDITAIQKLRVYNGSLIGGNIVEEKCVIETALERKGISVVLLLVHPAMTYSHEFRTVELKPELKRTALGSVSLWEAYKDVLNIRLGRLTQTIDYAGTETFETNARSEMNIDMKRMWSAPEFTLDPIALRAYLELVGKLRARGIQIVFIVPPTSEQLLRSKGVAMDRYVQRMRSEIGSGDLWIDFLSPEHQDICNDLSNFSDGVHLTAAAAKQVVAHINTSINRWIAEGRLMVPDGQ